MTAHAAVDEGVRGLTTAPIGVVPIVWNNADLLDLAPELDASTVLDEIARLGFAGCQLGRGFPEGEQLKRELGARSLRLAERYCALPTTRDGLATDAGDIAHRVMRLLAAADGEMLVVALDGGGDRDPWSGHVADGAPRWAPAAFERLAGLLAELAEAARPLGIGVAFHPHTGTWIETPDEVETLSHALEPTDVGLCLDVGHYVLGGGDPIAAIRTFGRSINHVHLKDVDDTVVARLRAGELTGFGQAVRERVFTELGNGILDLDGVLGALDRVGYSGWLMVEQDSSWLAPSEAAAVGRRVLRFALHRLGHGPADLA